MEKEKNINFGKLCIRYFYNRVRIVAFIYPQCFLSEQVFNSEIH